MLEFCKTIDVYLYNTIAHRKKEVIEKCSEAVEECPSYLGTGPINEGGVITQQSSGSRLIYKLIMSIMRFTLISRMTAGSALVDRQSARCSSFIYRQRVAFIQFTINHVRI